MTLSMCCFAFAARGSQSNRNFRHRANGRYWGMDSGLAGVVVAETVLSRSNGEQGILWVRGYMLP